MLNSNLHDSSMLNYTGSTGVDVSSMQEMIKQNEIRLGILKHLPENDYYYKEQGKQRINLDQDNNNGQQFPDKVADYYHSLEGESKNLQEAL